MVFDRPRLTAARSAGGIRQDMAEAQKAGITGTPAFYLAYTDPGSSKVKTVTALKGARPFADFKAAIDALLAEPPKTGPEKPAAP